jgi:Holliday junction resolvase RusA-like endonuclease
MARPAAQTKRPPVQMGLRQTLVLEDFPRPEMARALSPNGRAHWAVKRKVKDQVELIVGASIFEQRLSDSLLGHQVRITYRWIFPDRRKRDLDNHSTGVVKSVQDAFVRLGLIDADDTSCVVGITTDISVEPKRRALEITLEAVEQ